MTEQEALKQAIAQLEPIVAPLVKAIEELPPTTQNHYGDYMVAIERIAEKAGGGKAIKLAVGYAMTKVGASRAGIIAALRAIGAI